MRRPEQTPKLVFSVLSGRIYIVTRYQDKGNGVIVAERKYDATDDFNRVCLEKETEKIHA